MLVARGQIKEFSFIERIDVRELFLMLKDYAIELEIQRDIYRDLVILTAPSQNPEKFTIIDKIKKLYNQQYKTSIEKLVEGYKKEFGNNEEKVMTVRIANTEKKKLKDLIPK